MPEPSKYAQEYRLSIQPCRVRITDVSYGRRCVCVLFQEQAVCKALELGYGWLSFISETSGKRVFRDAPKERRHGLLRALMGDVQFHNVWRLAGQRKVPQAVQDAFYEHIIY